jgi:hypothetical protein
MRHALLFTIGIGLLAAGALFGQRGGGVIAPRAPMPSSTALGAGALSVFPSSTSRSSAPSFARQYVPGRTAYSGYVGGRTSTRSGTYARRPYKALPPAYFAAPYYYPFYDWGGDYSAPVNTPAYDDYGPDPTDALMANQAALGQQVQRLTAQMNDLMYGQQYQQPAPAAQQSIPPPVPLTLILHDGQQLQVQNYAVTDDTFWEFTNRGTRKIPLSDIDLAASAKATEAKGGEFPQIAGTQ